MTVLNTILKYEIKKFLIRKSMLKWYITLVLMNIFFLFLPQSEQVPITLNRPLLSIVFMIFSCLLVPNNLAIDVIGGEKYHKTAETLFATPLDIKYIFIGKTLFILLLGSISLLLTTLQNNIFLMIIYKQSFMDSGLHIIEILGVYTLTVLSIILIAFIGTIVSLITNNLKINGYLVAAINIILVVTIYTVVLERDIMKMLLLILVIFVACYLIFVLVTKNLTKKYAMKYIK